MGLSLDERWKAEYRHKRYLEHITHDALEQRLKDILCNVCVQTVEGKIGVKSSGEDGLYWLQLTTHLQEEFRLRFGPYPNGFRDGCLQGTQLPKATWPEIPKPVTAFKGMPPTPGSFLIKYGKREYLEPILKEGRIRIAPASSYKDPSLNAAIKDNELEFLLERRAAAVKIIPIDKKTGRDKAPLPPAGNIKMKFMWGTDYYVFCLSRIYDSRLFYDFEANSCLLITDPQQFVQRVHAGFEKLFLGWDVAYHNVSYLDPLRDKRSSVVPFFSKHFRYSYQGEYRAAWIPPPSTASLTPIELILGNLEDICKLIVLS